MSRLTDLITQAKATDPQMGADLEAEFRALTRTRNFGLVFEKHKPEVVELPQRPVRKGDKVRVLPPRGTATRGDQRLWSVSRVERVAGGRVAHLVLPGDSAERQVVNVEDCLVVAEFRDPIYPGLVETGRVERGGDKPFHTVINAENFHALEALTYTHRGAVDAIYIDPPYNTGARDWKYNNDYVEKDDSYRHSKWLSFMERRLNVAKELLNPADSVLIVTIDEKEYLRLGLLLEQVFPSARIQMISSVINPSGSSRRGMFSRTDEYIFFILNGAAHVSPGTSDMLSNLASNEREVRWDSLQRRGDTGRRPGHPELFYAIYFDAAGRLSHCSDPIPQGTNKATEVPGFEAVVPVKPDGTAMTWGVSGPELMLRLAVGGVRYYKDKKGKWIIRFLQKGTLSEIASGRVQQDGHDVLGFPRWVHTSDKTRIPMTTWKVASHSASDYATPMLTALLPNRRFPYPKSLYAVEDALRFFVKDKPDATIVDFFSGSGTTAHAVMRLNRQDGGRRRSISVTNNEVAADEQRKLRTAGLRPGDPAWEERGICDYITKPRIEAAITGKTPAGDPIKGAYRFVDEFPMAEGFEQNAVFYTLTYETPVAVGHNRAFTRVAPLLWLRAGSRGRVIDTIPERGWDVAETYGVLEDLDQAKAFVHAITDSEVRIAYIVTDDDRRFQMVCRELPADVLPLRLYESYLTNFEINTGRIVA